jgi:hypothetical protein
MGAAGGAEVDGGMGCDGGMGSAGGAGSAGGMGAADVEDGIGVDGGIGVDAAEAGGVAGGTSCAISVPTNINAPVASADNSGLRDFIINSPCQNAAVGSCGWMDSGEAFVAGCRFAIRSTKRFLHMPAAYPEHQLVKLPCGRAARERACAC